MSRCDDDADIQNLAVIFSELEFADQLRKQAHQ
jgi:hypothetical protein